MSVARPVPHEGGRGYYLPFSRHSGFARVLTVIKFSIGSDHFPPSTPGDKLFKSLSSHAHLTHLFNQLFGCHAGRLLETAWELLRTKIGAKFKLSRHQSSGLA